jgi:diaminopimelate epimerase
MKIKKRIYTAAGGNPTAIVLEENLKRENYSAISDLVLRENPEVEQVGFFEEKDGMPFLQMAGGEFCGNATRAFACLLKEDERREGITNFKFKVSGFENPVFAYVVPMPFKENKGFFCEARFPELAKAGKIEKRIFSGKTVMVVDLGGIIHILVQEDQFPFSEKSYEKDMKAIKDELGVDCDAVGVLWVKKKGEEVSMKPVVWVKSIDTCYYETSCGSGSIAVGMSLGSDVSVIQPSLKPIQVAFDGEAIILKSEMERTA